MNSSQDHAEEPEMESAAEETNQFTPRAIDERERRNRKINNETIERQRKESLTRPANGNAITLRCMKDVKSERVTWLWKPYIAKGKLTLLEGDPGEGKSWITLAIATAISRGKGLPGQATTELGSVIVASAEDGLGDTIRPRLDSMKADVSRIHAIDGAITFDDAGFALIERYIIEINPILLIIDPLVAYLGSGLDFHRANETRPVMARLAKLAEKYQLAILILRHLTKGSMNKAIYRGIGSIDFTAACRSVLMAGCDPDNSNNRGIVHIKSNLAETGPSQGYELRDDNFYWTGESTLTSSQIQAGNDNNGNLSEIDTASVFLKEELADGPVPANNVYYDAVGAGISKRTLNRAKSQIGIKTGRRGEKGKRGGGGWTWELPSDDLPCHHGNLNNEGVKNVNIATEISGNVNNSEANNLSGLKNLATLTSEEIVPAASPPADPPRDTNGDVPPADLRSREDSAGVNSNRGRQAPDLRPEGCITGGPNEDIAVAPQTAAAVDRREAILGMPVDRAIEIWRSRGSPLFTLGQGEYGRDMERLLKNPDCQERHLKAVRVWLDKVRAI